MDAMAVTDDNIARLESTQEPVDVESDSPHEAVYTGLLPMLERLDRRIAAAVEAANNLFAARAAGDLYRGLAISPADVVAALARVPGEPFLPLTLVSNQLPVHADSLSLRRLRWLQRVYSLTDFDLDIILVALAPEIDLRYERLYAYLHDDVTRRRPSVDLTLNLLCTTGGDKLRQRERFAPDAPLVRDRLIDLYAEPQYPNAPLLSRCFRLDEQIVRLLLLDDSLDSRLATFCEMAAPQLPGECVPLQEAMLEQLHARAAEDIESPLRIYFYGPENCGQHQAAQVLADDLESRLLIADLRSLTINSANASADLLLVLVREAWLRGALLYLRGVDTAAESAAPQHYRQLWQALKELPAHCVIEGKEGWIPAADRPQGVTTITFTYPDLAQRQQYWRQCLRLLTLETSSETLTSLAQRYRLTFSQIQDAAAVAATSAKTTLQQLGSVSDSKEYFLEEFLFAAARAQCGHDLATLATKVEPRATWDDLVLPEDETAQLRELCDRFIYRDKVLYEWGFAKKLLYGFGITALFSGGSGTGKTMAAEVIANALGLDLYRIDLAQVVSKYIGETEKNLDKVFTAATSANAILFFDEADALFGKRSEVKDSHDRYANLEISYLLQKMEQYEGIAILATNLSDNLDQAFTRRLAFSVHFPFPDEASRLHLWTRVWPEKSPVQDLMHQRVLARELKVAGGNIKNIALNAAFYAAENGGTIDVEHLLHAVRREYLKVGRGSDLVSLNAAEWFA
jgi:SpoVK/Ycf46/Vps4 family AAA+-type ATPase